MAAIVRKTLGIELARDFDDGSSTLWRWQKWAMSPNVGMKDFSSNLLASSNTASVLSCDKSIFATRSSAVVLRFFRLFWLYATKRGRRVLIFVTG